MEVQHHHNLQPYNTFGLQVFAQHFVEVTQLEELKEALLLAKELNTTPFFLGGGSNVLLCNDLNQLVILNKIEGMDIVLEKEEEIHLKILSGNNWHDTVIQCINNNWGGIENMSLIPGSVGAAPMQNIGAYGVELKDVFVELEALNLHTLQLETFDKKTCEFGYRESVFKRALKGKYFIYSVTLKLSTANHQLHTSYGAIQDQLAMLNKTSPEYTIKEVSDAVIQIRKSKLPDPKELGNSGSFFKNPVITNDHFEALRKQFPDIKGYPVEQGTKVPAGWLIEKQGWKGKKIGNTGSHAHQALVLVNYGEAKGNEVYQLAQDIIADIYNTFQIQLEPEVNIIS